MFKKSRISTKLLMIFFVIGATPIFLISIFIINSANKLIRSEITDGIVRFVEAKEGQVFAYLYSIEVKTKDLSNNSYIQETFERIINNNNNEDILSLNKYLLNDKIIDPSIIGISIANMDGTILVATDDIEIGKNEIDHDYFLLSLNAKEGEVNIASEETFHGHFGFNNSFIAMAPIYFNGKKIGIINVFFNTKILDSVLSGAYQIDKGAMSGMAGLSQDFEIYLINSQKRMFIHSGGDKYIDSMTKDNSDAIHFNGMVVDTYPVNSCLMEEKEVSGVYKNYNGVEVIGASMCISKLDWILVAETPKKTAFAASMELYYQIILILLSLIFFIIGLSLIFTSKIIEPIKELTKGAKNIEKGDLETKILINRTDEIGDLAESFNKMAFALKKSKNELSKKVEERTKDLEEANKYMVGRELKMIELKKEIKTLSKKK